MNISDNTIKAFFALIRAGLWEEDIQLLPFGTINYKDIYRLAKEQSILGLVAAGVEHVVDTKVPKEEALAFVGYTLQIEQQNSSMNGFIGGLIEKLNENNINTILLKGQGIAQCYERPLWRANGDVDLLLDEKNYHLAKDFLTTVSRRIEEEDCNRLHYAVVIEPWIVELHGTFRCGLGRRIDSVIDEIQTCTFEKKQVRVWKNEDTVVNLPSPDNDALFVFVHILQHFYSGGIGLRQVCDWCRLLWIYRSEIDKSILESRLLQAGIITEWKTFAALAVDTLEMPEEAMPLYDSSQKWMRKANRILTLIIETGNFGHNRDNSYQRTRSFFVRKTISLSRSTRDSLKRLMIFPVDAVRIWWIGLFEGIRLFIHETTNKRQ